MAPDGFSFPRSSRLGSRTDLQRVLRNGKRVRSELLELRGLASHLRVVRVGLIVPRHHQSAVARNRLKRQLREILRIEILPTLEPVEIVVRSLPGAYEASRESLRNDLIMLMSQLGAKVC